MKITLPQLQSLLGGFIDTYGFLALQGLFTAHVTGNFVTLGAALVLGTSGALAKLLALPVFCLAVVAIRLASMRIAQTRLPVLPIMLGLQAMLLAIGSGLAILLGPLANGDSWQAVLSGMVLVAAMAIQNATHRSYYPSAPPTTLMTGSTTQIMIDIADLLRGLPPSRRSEVQARLRRLAASVTAFAGGCFAAAALYPIAGPWGFLVAPCLAFLSLAPPIVATVAAVPAAAAGRTGS